MTDWRMGLALQNEQVIALRGLYPAAFTGQTPVDVGLNVAIKHLCMLSHPNGYDVGMSLDAVPTTLAQVIAQVQAKERFLIWGGECEGSIYACAETNMDLRAWHDKVHYDYNLDFNMAGEAAAVYIQIAQLMQVFGNRACLKQWAALIIADILGLVVSYRQAGDTWPTEKRNSTLALVPVWERLAHKLVDSLAAVYPGTRANRSAQALALAAQVWGNPHPQEDYCVVRHG